MKKLLVLVLCVLLIASACGAPAANTSETTTSNTPPSSDATYRIRIAHAVAETHASHLALVDVFKKQIEEGSNGRITVEIYPNAQLGSDRQAVEAVTLGSIEMTMCTMAVMSGFEEQVTILDLPFLFNSKEAVYEALDGELGDKLNELVLPHGIRNLGFAEGGFRNITNNRGPIYTPEDMSGLKIRTQENPIHVAAFNAFGANPTPMAFGELFTALQQKTVDGQENPINLIYASKFQEVQDYLSLTGHVYGTACFFINEEFWKGLPADLQELVQKAADEAKVYQRELCTEQDDKYLVELREVMEVNDLTAEQKQLFVDAAQSVYDEFIAKHGDELVELARKYNK